MEKIDAHTMIKEAQQMIRKQVIRLRKAGKTYREISDIVGIHKSTACSIYKKYEKGGHKAVKGKKVADQKAAIGRLAPNRNSG